ncbi:MAG: hemin uptake protein HemP [Vogesella sp.]|uniref:hemin uptake protein HemP n=1 Tax=Vogesella sp. TaxID=1904252 RepID=UPI00391D8CCE
MSTLSFSLDSLAAGLLPQGVGAGTQADVPLISSEQLFADCKALLIEHNGQQYRLQITKQNKLILTK